MKRWPLSIIGGFFIPLGYFVVLDLLNVSQDDNTFSWLLRLPLNWPVHICRLFYNPVYDPNEELHAFKGFEVYLLSFVIGNFIAYMLLTYALLSRLSKSEKLP